MTESVEAGFSTFVHPEIWVPVGDNPPAVERLGMMKDGLAIALALSVNRPVPQWDGKPLGGREGICNDNAELPDAFLSFNDRRGMPD